MTTFTSIKLHVATFSLLTFGISVVAQQPAGSPSLPVAQPPQTAPDSSTVTLKVKAKLTIEDVTVTDGKGKPVRGLTQSDFTVKEDGKPQTIQNFEEHGTEQSQAAPPKLPPNTYTIGPADANSQRGQHPSSGQCDDGPGKPRDRKATGNQVPQDHAGGNRSCHPEGGG